MAAGTKQRIIDAATNLFGEKGYHSTTIQDIAESVHIRSALIYYYFSSKEELLFEVMYGQFKETHLLIKHVSELSLSGLGKAGLASIVRSTASVLGPTMQLWSQGNLLEDIFTAEHRADYLALRHQTTDLIRSFVQQGVDVGEIAVADVTIGTLAVIGMADSLRNWFRPGGSKSLAGVTHLLADMVIKLLAAPDSGLQSLADVVSTQQLSEFEAVLTERYGSVTPSTIAAV